MYTLHPSSSKSIHSPSIPAKHRKAILIINSCIITRKCHFVYTTNSFNKAVIQLPSSEKTSLFSQKLTVSSLFCRCRWCQLGGNNSGSTQYGMKLTGWYHTSFNRVRLQSSLRNNGWFTILLIIPRQVVHMHHAIFSEVPAFGSTIVQ